MSILQDLDLMDEFSLNLSPHSTFVSSDSSDQGTNISLKKKKSNNISKTKKRKATPTNSSDDDIESKKMKRRRQNREAARRARARKVNHIAELEAEITRLKEENNNLKNELNSMKVGYHTNTNSNNVTPHGIIADNNYEKNQKDINIDMLSGNKTFNPA